MCPVCWASALTSFVGLVVASIAIVAGNDRWCRCAALALAIMLLIHRASWPLAPTWSIALLTIAAATRISYLLVVRRDELLFYKAWRRASQFAASRCPHKLKSASSATTSET